MPRALLARVLFAQLLAEALVAFDRHGIVETQLFLQGSPTTSRLQEADGKGLAEQGRTDALVREACRFVQPQKELGDRHGGERIAGFGEKEMLLLGFSTRRTAQRQAVLIHIGEQSGQAVGTQRNVARVGTVAPHAQASLGTIQILQAARAHLGDAQTCFQEQPEERAIARRGMIHQLPGRATHPQQALKLLGCDELDRTLTSFGHGAFDLILGQRSGSMQPRERSLPEEG